VRRRDFLWLGLSAPLWAWEAPQIWRLNGGSLADSRSDLEQRLGRHLESRPLKASFLGETWEYRYAGGLIAAFSDRQESRHPRLLVGQTLSSRGERLLQKGMSEAEVERFMLGKAQAGLYRDEDRQAYLSVRFRQGKLSEMVLARPPGLPER
jgi:hypothetical protein